MTVNDNKKLDLILEKIGTLESDVSGLKADVADLKTMQEFTFDEVERVHQILEKHIADTSKHHSYA